MNPVIHRELREQSRSPALFRLRLIGAAGVIGALVWGVAAWAEFQARFHWGWGGMPGMQSEGGFLFARVQMALTFLILMLAPTLTADAIARERRESTLNLLGLTPLTARAVALGKSTANALRALTLWLAAVPILVVPVLKGGVGFSDMVEVVTVQLTVLLLGLAAGLVASSITVQFRRALALSFVMEGFLLAAVLFFQGALVLLLLRINAGLGNWWPEFNELGRSLGLLPRVLMGNLGDRNLVIAAQSAKPAVVVWVLGLLGLLAAAGLVGIIAIQIAARRVGRLWQEEPARPGSLKLQRQLTRPLIFPGWIRQRQRARLSRNPLVWIQHRTVAAALTRWGWTLVVMVVWMLIASTGGWMGGFPGHFSVPVWVAPLFLLGGMAFSAAGGFRAERENGTLELLLVTPLSVNQLLHSRWLAHLREFLFPVALQFSLSIYVEGLWRRAGVDYTRFNWWLVAALLCFPAIGLWRGLRARSFIAAVLGTVFWGVLIPALAALVFLAVERPGFFEGPALLEDGGLNFFLQTRLDWGVLPAVFQLLVGVIALVVVRRELTSRQFAHATSGKA